MAWLTFVYPERCCLCFEKLAEDEKDCCRQCYHYYQPIVSYYCSVCGKPVDENENRCFDCRRRSHIYEAGRSLWLYHEAVKKSLYRLKHGRQLWIGVSYGRLLYQHFSNQVNDWQVDMVVAVPQHWLRLGKKGYNQSEVIAKSFARDGEWPFWSDVFRVAKRKTPQKELGREQRQVNLKNTFFVRDGVEVSEKVVLLIDDVYTTGATMDACSQALMDAGAKKVYYLTLAIGKGIN